jgi:hypothetical protein
VPVRCLMMGGTLMMNDPSLRQSHQHSLVSAWPKRKGPTKLPGLGTHSHLKARTGGVHLL